MRMHGWVRAMALGLLVMPSAVAAQMVGRDPAKSPFRDLEWKHQWTGFAGVLNTSDDVAGVGPSGGLFLGTRYDIAVGGPVAFTGRLAYASGTRDVKDPARPAATRLVGSTGANLMLADLGITMTLTGKKSWKGIAPMIGGGFGFVTDFKTTPDTGGYFFGSKFAFNWGPSVRIQTGKRLEWCVELINYLWQMKYPDSYRTKTTTVTPLVPDGSPLNGFAGNWAFTVGGSYGIIR